MNKANKGEQKTALNGRRRRRTTPPEPEVIELFTLDAKSVFAAQLLADGATYREVNEHTGLALATISKRTKNDYFKSVVNYFRDLDSCYSAIDEHTAARRAARVLMLNVTEWIGKRPEQVPYEVGIYFDKVKIDKESGLMIEIQLLSERDALAIIQRDQDRELEKIERQQQAAISADGENKIKALVAVAAEHGVDLMPLVNNFTVENN